MHILTQQQLLDWFENHVPDPAIRSALLEGKVELLGHYSPSLPPYEEPGWAVKITSKRGTVWYCAILKMQIFPPRLECRLIKEPPGRIK